MNQECRYLLLAPGSDSYADSDSVLGLPTPSIFGPYLIASPACIVLWYPWFHLFLEKYAPG